MSTLNIVNLIDTFRNTPTDPKPIKELFKALSLSPSFDLDVERISMKAAALCSNSALKMLVNHWFLFFLVSRDKFNENWGYEEPYEDDPELIKMQQTATRVMKIKSITLDSGYGTALCEELGIDGVDYLNNSIPTVQLFKDDDKKYTWEEISALVSRTIDVLCTEKTRHLDEDQADSIIYGAHLFNAYVFMAKNIKKVATDLQKDLPRFSNDYGIDILDTILAKLDPFIETLEDLRDLYAKSFNPLVREFEATLSR